MTPSSAAKDDLSSTATPTPNELADLAAILWSSNEKALLKLGAKDAADLEQFLGSARMRREIVQDPELAAARKVKGTAAATLLAIGDLDPASCADWDAQTVMGLYSCVRDALEVDMHGDSLLGTVSSHQAASSAQPDTNHNLSSLVVSGADLVLQRAMEETTYSLKRSTASGPGSGPAGILGEMGNLDDARPPPSKKRRL